MASWLPSFDSSSLGRNVLVGISIGLGIGIGIGAGMAASRRMFTAKVQDQNLVVRFTELTEEIRELRCVMVRLEVTLSETRDKRIIALKHEPSLRGSVQSDEETEEDEYYEMSGEEPSSRCDSLSCFDFIGVRILNIYQTVGKASFDIICKCIHCSASDVDQLKTVIDEVERLHSNNAEDKQKIHRLLEECAQVQITQCT